MEKTLLTNQYVGSNFLPFDDTSKMKQVVFNNF